MPNGGADIMQRVRDHFVSGCLAGNTGTSASGWTKMVSKVQASCLTTSLHYLVSGPEPFGVPSQCNLVSNPAQWPTTDLSQLIVPAGQLGVYLEHWRNVRYQPRFACVQHSRLQELEQEPQFEAYAKTLSGTKYRKLFEVPQ